MTVSFQNSAARPPLPPFTRETAAQKVRPVEDVWNSRDPARVALAYTEDSHWRIREDERKLRRPLGPRPDGHPGLPDLGI